MTKPNEPDPRLADKLSDEPKNESPAESDPGDGSSNADPDSENDTPERRTPERKLPDSVPVFARPRLGERDFIAYSSTRSSQLTGAPERSEARYVPQAPKLYMPPSSAGGEEHEANFPEVPADTWRLFVAIEIPRALKREFMDLAQSFRPREYERVRWIDQDGMHLTLKFLGDTPTSEVDGISAVLARAASSTGKFSIKVGRTGCFPSFRDPRICWVGVTGELRRLEQLQGRVEGGLAALGFDTEERAFKPHVTIGRTRPGIRGRFAEDIGVSWQHAPLHSTGKTIPVAAIALYRSYLDEKEGTHYEQVGNFELG